MSGRVKENAILVERHLAGVVGEGHLEAGRATRVKRIPFNIFRAIQLDHADLVRGGEEGAPDIIIVGKAALPPTD